MRDFSNKYLKFLKVELKGLNLTRILDSEEFYQKQIVDSIQPAQDSAILQDAIANCEYVVDIGFGGGFPILPLAKKFPHTKFVGFEAREKKVIAVKKIVSYFKMGNVQLIHNRIENILGWNKKVNEN